MSQIPGRLITYCTNIHPAETWRATFAALQKHIPAIKAAVSPDQPFPIGLRLSNRAAMELGPEEDARFRSWLDETGCFVPTINGFPFGSFHGKLLKKRVYLPDWRSPERADYTLRLAKLLAGWLPQGGGGSISTVPLGYKSVIGRLKNPFPEMRMQLEAVLTRLSRILDDQGKVIVLALEPEPGCLLETTDDVCNFFSNLNLPQHLMRHLAICYDCCHQAIQFEEPGESLRRLTAAGVPVAKIQVSSALKVRQDYGFLLTPFDEPFYLHQVVVRSREGALSSYHDLTEAIHHHHVRPGDEWRCHFHVPIFTMNSGKVETTADFLIDLLPLVPPEILLEVETYTWGVLPSELRTRPITQSIIREIDWLKEHLHA